MRALRILCLTLLLGSAVAIPAAWSAARPARAAKPVLPWIADDYPRAVALARARHVPIFVENWAPW